MSEEIKVGDLVMVVRGMPCCGVTRGMGVFGKVLSIQECSGVCPNCDRFYTTITAITTFTARLGAPIYRLKKINPPAISDETQTERDVTA